MANQDNPIFQAIHDVLGIGRPPKSFSEKIDLLRNKLTISTSALSGGKTGLSLDRPLVIFDLETTGLNPNKNKIFEASFRKIYPSGKIEEMPIKLNPGQKLPADVERLTGKSSELVNSSAWGQKFDSSQARDIKRFLSGADIAGYNVGFDISFLRKEMQAVGVPLDTSSSKILDVMALTKNIHQMPYGAGYKLSSVYENLVGGTFSAHSAVEDVRATETVLHNLLTKYKLGGSVDSLAEVSNQAFGSGSPFYDIERKAGGLAMGQGLPAYKSRAGVAGLADYLIGKNRLPASAKDVMMRSLNEGGYFVYQGDSLFYSTGHATTRLPIGTRHQGIVSFGGKYRQALSGINQSFLDLYYASLAKKEGIHLGVKQANKELAAMLDHGPSVKGIFTPEEGIWKHNALYASGDLLPGDVNRVLNQRSIGASARAMLYKTAGRVVHTPLKEIAGKSYLTSTDAFKLIDDIDSEYRNTILSYLEQNSSVSSYVFIKPEHLTKRGSFLLASKELSEMWGTRFEEGPLKKGLYQLAKLRRTTHDQVKNLTSIGEDIYAPYVLSSTGERDMLQRMKLRVAVVDTKSALESRLYFGESGMLLTERGAKKFATKSHAGTVKFSSPSIDLINAVERVFGTNLSTVNPNVVNLQKNFEYKNFYNARDSLKKKPNISISELTPIERDLRLIMQHSGDYAGLLNQMLKRTSISVSKIQHNDGLLRLDFMYKSAVVPTSAEVVVGTRRYTGVLASPKHELMGQIPKAVQNSVDAIIAADDMYKMSGSDVLLTNFIEQVRGTDNAGQIFKAVFKQDAHFATHGKVKSVVARILTHDDAVDSVIATLDKWKTSDNVKLQLLSEKIRHGEKVIESGLQKLGIKSFSIFGLGGALRTDVMGDINMMNPIKFGPSKMAIIAGSSSMLGYKDPMDNPVYKALTKRHSKWNNKDIYIDNRGRLQLSKNNIFRVFARGLEGEIDQSKVVTMGPNGSMMFKGRQLDALPGIREFSFAEGGADFKRLSNTILGLDEKIVYLDMGEGSSIDLLGLGSKAKHKARYVPIPLDLMGLKSGNYQRLVLNKGHRAFGIVQSLTELSSGATPEWSKGMVAFASSLMSKEGLLNARSTIKINLGTRARFAPMAGNFFSKKDMFNPERLFDVQISESDFEDYLARKSGFEGSKKDISAIRKQLKENNFFYSLLQIDPMQRGEHANVVRVFLDKSRSSGLEKTGKLNITAHPLLYPMLERDLDRDALTFLPLSGRADAKELEQLLKTQQKLSSHFMWFRSYDLMQKKTEDPSSRLSGLMDRIAEHMGNIKNYFGAYLGTAKSTGYSITRAVSDVMNTIVMQGTEGAAKLGIVDKKILTSDAIDLIVKNIDYNPEKLAVTSTLLQNLFQGGIKKGDTKAKDLLNLVGEELVEIATSVKGKPITQEVIANVSRRGTDAVIKLLEESDDRAFMAMDYLFKENKLDGWSNETLALVKADVERGATEALGQAASERRAKFKKQIIQVQAELIGPYLGVGFAIAGNLRKSTKSIFDIIRKTIKGGESPEDIARVMAPLAEGSLVGDIPKQVGDMGAQPKAPKTIADGLKKDMAEKASSSWPKYRAYLRSKGAAIGIGAAVGAGLHAMMSGPEPPMPRDIDARQPTDLGPELYARAPKIYSNNQNFSASQNRYNNTPQSTQAYSMSSFGESTVTYRDKTLPVNPYLLKKHIDQISNSDYTY